MHSFSWWIKKHKSVPGPYDLSPTRPVPKRAPTREKERPEKDACCLKNDERNRGRERGAVESRRRPYCLSSQSFERERRETEKAAVTERVRPCCFLYTPKAAHKHPCPHATNTHAHAHADTENTHSTHIRMHAPVFCGGGQSQPPKTQPCACKQIQQPCACKQIHNTDAPHI